MDIARPDLKRRRNRRRILFTLVGLIALSGITLGLSRLQPAAPSVDGAQVWTNAVKRGEMIREVRGNGTLVPEKIVTIQSDTGGTVEDILVWPGAEVKPDTVLLVLTNPQLKQDEFDQEWQVKAAEAKYQQLQTQLETDRFAQQAVVTTSRLSYEQAKMEASAEETLFAARLEAELIVRAAQAKANGLKVQHDLEEKRLELLDRSADAQRAVQKADLEKLRALLKLKQDQVAALRVRAGIHGVLQQIGDVTRLQIGERVAPGATLAKVVRPEQLKAEIKIAETQARDIRIGQSATIDTRNGIIPGHVVRVDPAVVNGTRTVDVKLDGPLPRGAVPDLSVDGTIQLERLEDVLYVGRPVHGQTDATIGLFKVDADGYADRVTVKLGRSSVSTVEILSGLKEGDVVILSDMSQWDEYNRIKLR